MTRRRGDAEARRQVETTDVPASFRAPRPSPLAPRPSSLARYFCETPITGAKAFVIGAEAHHLAHVMRARVGTEVILFDGGGSEFVARVERIERNRVELSIIREDAVDRELPFALTIAVALPKGERQRWLIEKAVELGVSRLIPLSTERAVAEANANAIARLGRGVIEASKQSGRNRLLTIAAPLKWTRLITGSATPGVTRAVADTKGATHVRSLLDEARLAGPDQGFEFAVGPEGGLTRGELDLARTCGWHIVGIGPRILRVETAAICLAAMAAALDPVSSSEFIPSRQEQKFTTK